MGEGKKRGGAPKGNKYAKGHGAPTKYEQAFDEQAYKLCLLGHTDAELATFFEVTETTINNWKITHPSFFESIKRGKDIADSNVATRLYQRAMGYEHEGEELKVVSLGQGEGSEVQKVPIKVIYPPDATSAIFWLKNRQPKKWRDKQDHDLTTNGKDVNQVTIFELPNNNRDNDNQTSGGIPDEIS